MCPIPSFNGADFRRGGGGGVGGGQFISGHLANRLGSLFGMNTKSLHGVIGLIMII